EPGPRFPRDPIPGFRDRFEPADLLDGAVLPFGLDIPMARRGRPDLARLEDRPGTLGKAGGHAIFRNTIQRAARWIREIPEGPEQPRERGRRRACRSRMRACDS